MTEIEYTHVLDRQGQCNCGWFGVSPGDPDFTTLAAKHFRETTEQAARDQTGWRGLLNRLRGKT